MTTNKVKLNNKGFTIIEVLIVLAIAGLIMLIVFLAVPALQRTARNTQRKNDVSGIASMISNYVSNNGGTLPSSVGYITSDIHSVAVYCGATAPSGVTADNNETALNTGCAGSNYEQAKLGYYAPNVAANMFIGSAADTTPTQAASGCTVSTTTICETGVFIDLGYQCNSTGTGTGNSDPRSAAIIYVTENGSANGSVSCLNQ